MKDDRFSEKRRDCLRILGAGALGGLLGGPSNSFGSVPDKSVLTGSTVRPRSKKYMDPATVILVKGDNRREIIYQSMMNLKDEIIEAIGNKKVLIKPNLV